MDTKSLNAEMLQARNVLDLNGLNSIRQKANANDKASKDAGLKEAAQQFEAIFMQMLLKSMRQAQDVLESDSPFNSQSTKFYREMHDQQLAVELSSKGTLGLADLIERQLGGGNGNFTPSSVLRMESTAVKTNSQTVNNTQENSQDIASNNRQLSSNENVTQAFRAPVYQVPKDFVTALAAPAKNVEKKLGVPFEVVIAQAALETGWGQKIIQTSKGASSNNLFNIKADSRWSGDKVSKDTLEFEQGNLVKKHEPFRVYASIEDSFNDYTSFLSSGTRYQEALAKPDNVEHFLQGLQKAGYATDPNYAEKILGTLKTVTSLLSN